MFNVEKVTNELVQWIRDWFEENGKGCNAVIGISGGKDSSVAAALCVEALGRDRVIGVLMPCGEQADISCSYKLVNHLGIKHFVINVKDAIEGLKGAFPEENELTSQANINLPPRIRMSTLYAVSQSHNGRVCNTCNLCEILPLFALINRIFADYLTGLSVDCKLIHLIKILIIFDITDLMLLLRLLNI